MRERHPVERMIAESDPEGRWSVTHVLSGQFYERIVQAPSNLIACMFARRAMREDGLDVDRMEFVSAKRID